MSAGLPSGLALAGTVDDAIRGADAIVVATEWPVFRELTGERIGDLSTGGKRPLVLDANRFLAAKLGDDARVKYVAVGTAPRVE
jgi:UDPglucose 6-dehydrogenase